MNETPDIQGRPNADHRTPEGAGDLPEGGASPLTPDLRGEALEQGRDPEEVDPISLDEDALRRLSSAAGTTPLP